MWSEFFELKSFEHRALFDKCVEVWDVIKLLNDYLMSCDAKIEVEISKDVFLVNRHLISIGKGTVIEPTVFIEGPCIIGENCQIRHGAYIRGGVLIGDGCVIGHASEIKHSILLNGVKAPHFNYVGDAILGNGVNLGSGVIIANYRLDGEEIGVYYKGKKILTGMNKLGAIVGDGASIGCNSVTNPGSLIGKMAKFPPCSSIKGAL